MIEININIAQSTCNLKCSVTIYIYYTEEKQCLKTTTNGTNNTVSKQFYFIF